MAAYLLGAKWARLPALVPPSSTCSSSVNPRRQGGEEEEPAGRASAR